MASPVAPQDPVADPASPAGHRRALDLVTEAVALLDPEGRLQWFNEAATSMSGMGPEDLGRPWRDVLPESCATEADHVESVRPGAPPHTFPSLRVDRYGMSVHVEVTVAPVEDDGRLTGIAVTARDVSEQELLQHAVAEMAQRADEIQSLAHLGLWVWDRDSDNVQWTQEAHRIMGVAPREFRGDLEAHIAPVVQEEREHVREAFFECLRSGEPIAVTVQIETPDGRRWVSLRARTALEDGEVTGLVGTAQDVTEQHRYAAAVESANRELERFAGAIAHDLKTPLTVVVGMADLLRDRVDDDETSRMLIDKLIEAGSGASEMIAELIESARTDAQRRAMTPVDLNAVMDRVRGRLLARLAEVGGRLQVAELPTVVGVVALLRQLMFNLLGNAIKYRHPDRELVVRVTGEVVEGVTRVRFEDNGLGISPDQRMAVLTGGYRAHADLGIEGDGMGLATCREIMEQHEGSIRIEDGIDGGIAVVLEFPRSD